MCKIQNFTCKICKKIGHFTSLCKAPTPERRNPNFTKDTRNTTYQQNIPQTRRVRHIKEQQQSEEEAEEETVDAEAALYIKELMGDWSSVNIIRPTAFEEINNVSLNKETGGEFWLKTNFGNKETDWIADTGSPRSFMQESKAKDIVRKHPLTKISTFNEKTRYKCFNNQDIQITGVLHLTLKSGSWTATKCNILLVSKLPQNVMGRDIFHQLGIHLTATKPTDKTIGLLSDTSV